MDAGPPALAALLGDDLPEVLALEARCAPPLTSSLRWLDAWIASHPDVEPWPRAVRRDGELVAWCLLAVERGPIVTVSMLGRGLVDRRTVLAVDEDAVEALAERVAGSLRRVPGPWRFVAEQLAVEDPIAAALARRLPGAVLHPGDACPVVDVDGVAITELVSRSWRKQVRQAAGRIERAGSTHEVTLVEDEATLRALLPTLAAIRVARDNALGRVSELQHDSFETFWRGVILGFAARGLVRCFVLRIDGEVVAYDLAFVHGDTLCLWDGRFLPEHGEFWPGKILLDADLRLAVDGPFRRLDLMQGDTPQKRRLTEQLDAHVNVLAWSGRASRGADTLRAAARQRVRTLRDDSPAVERAVTAVRQLQMRRG